MDDRVSRALSRGHTIDITTTGRRTGLPRRIEIVFFVIEGRIYISGMPNPKRQRAWLLNLGAHPAFTFHLKGAVAADLPATARIVTDPEERRALFGYIVQVWKGQQVQVMDRYSPLIEVTVEGYQPEIAA
ncbi:MAG TPA: nitroreductase/quinone reductase family protein [Candidatus Limnocylindria bacterium]|nr:nitroreductase/quinone reductase family protein [Candidatus Limnocylindria bacterium]